MEYHELDRLNVQLGHRPIRVERKLECIVCATKRNKLNLTRQEMRHESRIKCSKCNGHLCIEENKRMLY